MHPQTAKRQSAQPTRERAMTTEYQDRFLPPQCHMAVVSTTTQKNPYHPLKGTSADLTTFRTYYVTHKKIKDPPKVSQPSVHWSSSAPHTLAPKGEEYTSVYKHDFRAWRANRQQPCRMSGSRKVHRGQVVSGCCSKEGHCQEDAVHVEAKSKPVAQKKERHPFESVTSYRSDFVTHPLPPRARREKPVYQTRRLLFDQAAPLRSNMTEGINQELCHGVSDLFKKFTGWTLETKFQSQGKTDHFQFLSTTHADYTPHKCQRTKPVLPAMHDTGRSREPFQGLTTMREDYKAWATQQHIPVCKGEVSCRKPLISVWGPTPAHSWKTKPCSLHPKLSEPTVGNANKMPQCPAENKAHGGFSCFSSGKQESRMYWSTCVGRGGPCPDGENCEELAQEHQIISGMAASRS